ncbi:MAG: PspC domain-containing protein [Sphingomonadales bacterium]
MTHSNFSGSRFRARKLYRDPHKGLIRGVCAGMADSFRIDSLVVRLVAVIAFLLFPIATAAIYLIAGFALKERPGSLY